jgi:UPF0755 protein
MLKWLFRLFIVVLVAAAGAGWWIHDRLNTPFKGFSGDETFVELPAGSSVAAMAARLTESGIVRDALTFRIAARLSGNERRLQAGEYRFAGAATAADVVGRIARGDVYAHSVTFPEGLTIREMAELFGETPLGSAAEFRAAAGDTGLVAAIDPGARSLEGYLFPDTYSLSRRAGAEAMIRSMVSRFERTFDAARRERAAAVNMTPREVVTLASLVEKETAVPAERATVAAVYLNRLRIGMPLQCDPTVIYAMMLAGRWRGNITRADLQIDSPYNTYRYRGLPPGPIASPGVGAIDAVLAPADVPYLYFVSRNDGTHVFASTLAEHNRNVAEWQVRYFQRRRE